MQYRRKRFAAIALVLSLGLIVPSTLGGSALADVSGSRGRNPNLDETVFHCDLDGLEGYEVPYDVASANQNVWKDKDSATAIVVRLRVDALNSFYEVLDDPTGEAVDFADPDVYWWDGPYYPNGQSKGWQTVRCIADLDYEFTPTAQDLIDAPNLPFAFIPDDPETEEDEEKAATYLVTDTYLYDVTIGGNGPKAKSASADDAPSADRAVKAKKQGKHRGKGKRGR